MTSEMDNEEPMQEPYAHRRYLYPRYYDGTTLDVVRERSFNGYQREIICLPGEHTLSERYLSARWHRKTRRAFRPGKYQTNDGIVPPFNYR